MFEKILFAGDDGENVEFCVIEQTKVNGIDYLLVSEDSDDEDEATALIIKDVSRPEEKEAIYQIVEADDEIESVQKIFNELLEDIDIEM